MVRGRVLRIKLSQFGKNYAFAPCPRDVDPANCTALTRGVTIRLLVVAAEWDQEVFAGQNVGIKEVSDSGSSPS